MNCPRCSGEQISKYGFMHGKQRYICKECRRQFVIENTHSKPETVKLTAVLLYINGLSLRAIAKILHVSATAVLNWVRAHAEANYEKPEPPSDSVVVELDEMWHFLHAKKTNSGYGKPFAALRVNSLTGNVEIVMNPLYER